MAECLSLENADYGMSHKYVIKEFYPSELLSHISRKGVELIVSDKKSKEYYDSKIRFCNGVARQVAFSYVGSNESTLGCPEAFSDVNGTAYCILRLGNGGTLKDEAIGTGSPVFSACEIVQIMASLCSTIGELHIRNQLYLDIKPGNVFLFDKIIGKNRCIALFDFDTVYKKGNLPQNGPYSERWSPPEQREWDNPNEITEAADVYAIGALFYWLLTGDEVTYDILDSISFGDFSFLRMTKALLETDDVIVQTERILECSLRWEASERTWNLGKLVYMFNELEHMLSENGMTYNKRNSISDMIGLEINYMVDLVSRNRQKQIKGGKHNG